MKKTIRSRKEIKASLLKRAFSENRGAQVIKTIQERLSKLHNEIDDDIEKLSLFELKHFAESRETKTQHLLNNSSYDLDPDDGLYPEDIPDEFFMDLNPTGKVH